MNRVVPVAALAALLCACAADTVETPVVQHVYLVQYAIPINGADSVVIKSLGGTVSLAIPIVKSIVFTSTQPLSTFLSIPDKYVVSEIDSVGQVVNAIVYFKTAPTTADVSRLSLLATSRYAVQANSELPNLIETGFKLTALSAIGSIADVTGVDLDYPGIMLAGMRR